MIYEQNDITRQILLKYLAEGICQVSFTKVKDNTNRVMLCSLNPDMIPTKFSKAVGGVYQPTLDEDLLPVWDMSMGAWKSFRISKVNSFRTPDELTKQDKPGQDVESTQEKKIEERKKKVMETFHDRVQKQKDSAEKSKEDFAAYQLKVKQIYLDNNEGDD